MLLTIIVFLLILVVVSVISFFIGKEFTRKEIEKNLDNSYFGTMVVNMNLIEKDNFVETKFNYSPRELLNRDLVIFDVKIRE
jgi:hypothetical protein